MSANKDHTPAVIGGTFGGVAAGVVVAAFIGYLLYRRHKKKALNDDTGVSFPPDSPMDKPGFKHVADAELDTHPNMVVELPTSNDPGELDATPTSSPTPNDRVSAMTSGDIARWSAVTSLSPPRVHNPAPAASITPMAASLQAVSQQHYGPGQQSYLLVPGDIHHLYRSPSGPLPTIQVSGSQISLTSRSGAVVGRGQSEHPRDDEAAQRAQDDEKAQGSEDAQTLKQTHPTEQGELGSKVERTANEADDRNDTDESTQTSKNVSMNQGSQAQTSRTNEPSPHALRKRNSW